MSKATGQINHKKRVIFWLVVVVFAIIAVVFFIAARSAAAPLFVSVLANGQTIKAEVANTPAAIYRGLSGRPTLCLDCGMLFVFQNRQERKFVMRGMNFPLDIIFIADGKIIKIAANLPPAGFEQLNKIGQSAENSDENEKPPVIYYSDGPADQVLELHAGSAARYNLKVGDQILVNSSQ